RDVVMLIILFKMKLIQLGATHYPYTTLFRSVGEAGPPRTHRTIAPEGKEWMGSAGSRWPDHRVRRDHPPSPARAALRSPRLRVLDRKSTRLNSSHVSNSYAVFCLKNKKKILN